MSRYENIFDQVGDAKPINSWAPNIPEGKHQVALVKYGGKVSGKDKTIFLEAEFIVLATNNAAIAPGTRYSCPWFINKPDEFGYTHARAKDFLETVQRCLGNEEDVKAFGRALAEDFESDDPQGFGILLDVVVAPVLNASGEARRGKKGNEVLNSAWSAIPQSAEDIAATRAQLVQVASHPVPMRIKQQPVAQEPAAPEPIAPVVSNGKKAGGLGTLLGRRP